MFERFTERARRVMVLAQEEARLLGHNFIGTEHLLLGLVREGEGIAAQALAHFGITLESLREKVEETIGAPPLGAAGPPPFTPRAKRVLELSLREALELGHNYIGTEHILLGIIREGDGVGARLLVEFAGDLATVHQQVIELLSGYSPTAAPRQPGGPSGSPPDCPHCRASLAESARTRRLDLAADADHAGEPGSTFIVVYCDACGRSLAFKPTD
jgi:ATP-dependent Clp protease ATP-binding subunit ClpC